MDPMHDPAIAALPHPVRVDAVFGKPIESLLFEALGIMPALRPYLTDPHASTEWIINEVPGIQPLALAQAQAGGGVNMGTFVLTMARARLRAHGDPIVQVSPGLQALLAETDLASELPARFLCSPGQLIYILFAQPNPWPVPNRLSGLHACEGAYVGTYTLAPHHPIHVQGARSQRLLLDPNKPTRVVEIVFTGSPQGKANVLDDASQDLVLHIQDEDESLASLLDRHLAFFRSPTVDALMPLTPIELDEVELLKPLVFELAKVLLYLNLPEAEQVRVTERTDLAKRLRGLGPKKAAKIRRKLAMLYDRTLLGPNLLPGPATGASPGDAPDALPAGATRHVKPHWRRGHFRRIRYGEGLSESRLGWIQPVLVNAAELTGPGPATGKTRPTAVLR